MLQLRIVRLQFIDQGKGKGKGSSMRQRGAQGLGSG